MPPITVSTEVDRSAEDVFAYATDPTRFAEWQAGVIDGRMDQPGTPAVGARCLTSRRIGGANRPSTSEVAHINPPRTWGVRGIDGPIRPVGKGSIEPLDGGERSRFTIEFDFEAPGIGGKLLRPIALAQARKAIPKGQQRLKERLESGAV